MVRFRRGPRILRLGPSGPRSGISPGSEWPLMVFTLMVTAMVGWILPTTAGGPAFSIQLFLGSAALAMGISTFHLGKPGRAWRALRNIGRSWLSREVATFGGFVAASSSWIMAAESSMERVSWLGYPSAGLGLACLFCIDRVYDPVRSGWRIHSADTLLTGPLLSAAILQWTPAALALAGLKLALYLFRPGSPGVSGSRREWTTFLSTAPARVGIGLLLPMTLWLVRPELSPAWFLIPLAVGEVIDRIQFYGELAPQSPRRLMREPDLEPAPSSRPVA